jgi:hypothetical protein
MNPIHTLQHFCNIHFSIILLPKPMSSEWRILFRLTTRIVTHSSSFSMNPRITYCLNRTAMKLLCCRWLTNWGCSHIHVNLKLLSCTTHGGMVGKVKRVIVYSRSTTDRQVKIRRQCDVLYRTERIGMLFSLPETSWLRSESLAVSSSINTRFACQPWHSSEARPCACRGC